MNQPTKFLSLASFLVIIFGFIMVWYGLNSAEEVPPNFQVHTQSTQPNSTQSPFEETTSAVNDSAVLVTKVTDGDTIEVTSGVIVRLLGIDTPETVDPRRPVECFGKEASNKLKELVLGKEVVLEKDISETDKYNRLLRYVYLEIDNTRTLFINDFMIREGFAKLLTYPPDVKYAEQFLDAQRQAREQRKGIWGSC